MSFMLFIVGVMPLVFLAALAQSAQAVPMRKFMAQMTRPLMHQIERIARP